MIRNFIDTMIHAQARRRDRNIMTRLSDRELADIGLTRDEAHDDNLHGIWDAPQIWKAPRARGTTARLPRVASIY